MQRVRRLVALLTCALAIGAVPPMGGARASNPSPPPSIVLILTDDQRYDSLWAMPIVKRELVNHGVTFTNAFVVNSLCCPSRASILTGQYSHSTGVYANRPPHGGFEAFLRDERSTIATWLHRSGYLTGLIGKYLNHYAQAGKSGYVPPGWDVWKVFALNLGQYYDYPLNVNGKIVHYHHHTSDYSTNVLGQDAVQFIHKATGPFFLELSTTAPHGPATPAPADIGAFSNVKPYRPPNYDEADTSDKPDWVRNLHKFSKDRAAYLDAFHERQNESLLAVDRAVGRIMNALRDTHRLNNTMIVFTSDNGIAWGEHRWGGKKNAYEESIRIPLVVRYDPMISRVRSDAHLVLNIDLAPTFAQLAGVNAPGAEGQSFLPLLNSSAASWRSDFLIEHLQDQDAPIPTFCSVRTERYLYVVYADGEEELYDLDSDPYELQNSADDPSMLPTLMQLRQRTKELCKPPPPGFTFPY